MEATTAALSDHSGVVVEQLESFARRSDAGERFEPEGATRLLQQAEMDLAANAYWTAVAARQAETLRKRAVMEAPSVFRNARLRDGYSSRVTINGGYVR